MKIFCTAFLLLVSAYVFSQEIDTVEAAALATVTVKAFEQQRKLKDVAAAIGFINRQRIESFSSTSLVDAVNTLAGVRMEERSPGSYRFNIRGSSLRSPFGVRNVKVYYNGLPFTDPGGQTYLNALGVYNIESLEIIKGPGSSVYGAGTGGALLIESMRSNEKPSIQTELTAGSYNTKQAYVSAITGADETKNRFTFQHVTSNGYRFHSALKRDIVGWDGRFQPSNKSLLKTSFLYSRLFYETPGALTIAEYEAEPRAARPAAGVFPSAEQAKASIKQSLFLAGLSYDQKFSQAFSNTTSVYGMFTELRNPAIRNYGKNSEPHAGGRTSFRYQKTFGSKSIEIAAGGEWQQGFSTVSVYKNKNGEADSLQTTDDLPIRQSLVFLQAGLAWAGWELTGGSSLNWLRVNVRRGYPTPSPQQERIFSAEFSSRISLAKKWKRLTVYSSIAKGFSPPTSAELLPSGSAVNLLLNPEEGINYDLGLRGNIGILSYDVNAFFFRLQNAIVQRRDAGGGDYYINSGRTSQKGIETALAMPLLRRNSFLRQSHWRLSHTFHHFRYQEFKQLSTDYSGRALPGVAPHTVSTGIDAFAQNGLSINLDYFFSDKIPLNDANGDYAGNYHLLHLKIGYERNFGSGWRAKLQAGAQNLLNEKYSLGNDINAAGGRYYNAAPRRNFYLSLAITFLTDKNELKERVQ